MKNFEPDNSLFSQNMIGTIIIILLGHQKLVKPIQGLLSQHNQEVKLKPNNGQTNKQFTTTNISVDMVK